MAKPGDVFATHQPKGQYGAVRIIRKRGKEYLAYCSIYLGRKRPSLDDPALRKCVIQHRFEYVAEPALCWIEGEPPKARVVIQQWDSVEKIQAYRDSAAFKDLLPLRNSLAKFRSYAVEGVPQ